MHCRHYYMMRFRGAGPGCQPKGFVDTVKKVTLCGETFTATYDILVYPRKLEDAEVEKYELDYIGFEALE